MEAKWKAERNVGFQMTFFSLKKVIPFYLPILSKIFWYLLMCLHWSMHIRLPLMRPEVYSSEKTYRYHWTLWHWKQTEMFKLTFLWIISPLLWCNYYNVQYAEVKVHGYKHNSYFNFAEFCTFNLAHFLIQKHEGMHNRVFLILQSVTIWNWLLNKSSSPSGQLDSIRRLSYKGLSSITQYVWSLILLL